MMRKFFRDVFLNERLILVVIIVNAVVLFLQESGIENGFVNIVDLSCTIIFIIEMIVKHCVFGLKGYWSSGWNRLDGTLVILSLPSIAALVLPLLTFDFSFLLILRVLRVFRFFRLVHAFPGFADIMKNFVVAIRKSYAVFIGLLIMIITFAMIGCSLFRDYAPEYFATPLDAIYSTFRIFTGEGWNEIPDTIAATMGSGWSVVVRLYFCLILILGCIIGMSLLNSIFVDAMVSDNNDSLEEKIDKMEKDIEFIKNRM